MDCSAIRDLLVYYREKELGGQRKAAVESHLRLCEGCRKELRGIEEVVSAIAQMPAVDPWPGFSRRLQSRFEQQVSRIPGRRFRGWGPTCAWIAAGVFLILASVTVSWLLLPSDRLLTLTPKPDVRVTGRGDVSASGLGEREVRRTIGLWSAAADNWDELVDWPDRRLVALAVEKLEFSPEEAMVLWNEDLAGVSGLERVVELSGAPDAQVERVLDQVRR